MLPISMISGILFNQWIGLLGWLTPYLIFLMLTITFTRIRPSEFKITKFQWVMLAAQYLGCWVAYYSIYFFNPIVAEGAFLCIFIPTATAAPVITGMLGGSVSRLATFSLISNITLAITAPFFLSWISVGSNIEFIDSFVKICTQVAPLLLLPLVLAFALRYFAPKLHSAISSHQTISFWLWAVALFIVMGKAVSFMIRQPVSNVNTMIMLAGISLVVCLLQFYIGRKIGGKLGDKIAGAQGLGQKNTILALWISLTYLDPIISTAPATYIIWQNIINSWQLWRKRNNML